MRRAAALLVAMLALPAFPAAAPAQRLLTGFSDQDVFSSKDPTERRVALQHAKDAHASVIRTEISWGGVSRAEPPTPAAATDPNWMGYDWAGTDAHVRDAVAAGLQPILLVNGAPRWAEGADRPPVSEDAPTGSWRPNAAAYGRFAEAAARRYSGTTARPADPRRDAAARALLAGLERAQPHELHHPQWRRTDNGFQPESPEIYRPMLNAFYAGVKRADPSNVVATAGTAPFGDLHRGDRRMQPAEFVRYLFCVRGRQRPRALRRCPGGPVRFDVLAHHPYPIGSPHRTALNADDVNIPDIGKLTGPDARRDAQGLRAPAQDEEDLGDGVLLGHEAARPRGDLDAPAGALPRGLPLRPVAPGRGRRGLVPHARHGAASRATTRPCSPASSSAATRSSRTRPSRPTAPSGSPSRRTSSTVIARAWGIPPVPGPVVIEARRNGRWRALRTVRKRVGGVFKQRLRVAKGTPLRARVGSERSLTFVATPPLVGR